MLSAGRGSIGDPFLLHLRCHAAWTRGTLARYPWQMPKTRAELQQVLNDLESSIPQWKQDYPEEGDFIQAFAGVADEAFENVSAEDYDWLRERMDALQAHYGIGG